MADARVDALIDGLASGLTPVRRLRPPLLRAAVWLGVFALVAAAYYVQRSGRFGLIATSPYLLPAFVAALVTAVLAAVAAFEMSLPDRSDSWIWLPLPALALWLALSGLGCLADLGRPAAWGDTWEEAMGCLRVIGGSAILLSPVLIWMLRRARPERAVRVALLGGLASAAGAATILMLVHPHNSTLLDLAVHAVCIAAVIGLNTLAGGFLFGRTRTREPA
ncbi:MAG: DUF1109 family protein [Bauldia sp.]|nr:DUF1109 family protein [Bauldia sp.]